MLINKQLLISILLFAGIVTAGSSVAAQTGEPSETLKKRYANMIEFMLHKLEKQDQFKMELTDATYEVFKEARNYENYRADVEKKRQTLNDLIQSARHVQVFNDHGHVKKHIYMKLPPKNKKSADRQLANNLSFENE